MKLFEVIVWFSFSVSISKIKLNGESVQDSPSTTLTYPTTSTLSSSNWSATSEFRIQPEELTQTYFQYNQLCGDSCVLKDYHVTHDSCCEQCSCNLSTCNDNIAQSTCCPDLMNKLETYPKYFQKCIHPLLLPWKPGLPLSNATLMVTSCPRDYSGSEADKCENRRFYSDVEYNIPFTIFDKSTNLNVTYRNKFCAACWQHVDFEIEATRWRLAAICSGGKINMDIKLFDLEKLKSVARGNGNCTLIFTPPSQYFSTQTCGQGVAECNITGKWFKHDKTTDSVCQAFWAPFRRVYRNLFCYICNTNDEITTESFLGCEKDLKVNVTFVMITSHRVFWSATTKIVDEEHAQVNISRCSKKQILDRVQNKCFPITCRFYKVFDVETGRCEPLVEAIGGLSIIVYLKYIPTRRNCFAPVDVNVSSIYDTVKGMLRTLYIEDISSVQINYVEGNDKMCNINSLTELLINDVDYFITEIKLNLPVEEHYDKLVKLSTIEKLITAYHGRQVKIFSEDSKPKNFTVIAVSSNGKEAIKEKHPSQKAAEEDNVANEDTFNNGDGASKIDKTTNENEVSEMYDVIDNGDDVVRVLHVVDTCAAVQLDSTFYNVSFDKYGFSIDSFRIHSFEFILDKGSNDILICKDTFEKLQYFYTGEQTTLGPDGNSNTIDITALEIVSRASLLVQAIYAHLYAQLFFVLISFVG